ncbi:MAG: glycosyltransferase [Puniceicoccaceae bacterium]
MRIVIYQDYLRVGGTESQSLYLAKRLLDMGHEVTVLTNRPGGRLRSQAFESGLAVKNLQAFDFHLNWFAPDLVRQLQNLRPEIVLLMGRNANGTGSLLQRKLRNTLVVSTVRTGRPFTRAYQKSLKSAPLICCNSVFAARRLEQLGIARNRIAVHPNPCLRASDIDALAPRHTRPRSANGHLIYVAAFVPGKNHASLIRLMPILLTRFKGLTLTLVGEGPLQGRMQKLVRSLGLDANIVFAGYRRDIPELLAQADLAISPSLEESLPNALVEAQYAGLPVVAFEVAGVGECLLHGQSGLLVPPGDMQEFGKAVSSVLMDEASWRSMAESAHRFAHLTFEPNLRFDAFIECVMKYRTAS